MGLTVGLAEGFCLLRPKGRSHTPFCLSLCFPDSHPRMRRQYCALSFDSIDFPLSKLIAFETRDFQNVLVDLLKCYEKGQHPMDDCFVERTFQMIVSIAVFKDGFGSLNDIAKSFALNV